MNKKEKNALVPELRFPAFKNSDGWEEKRLNQITDSIFDGTHQTPRYTEQGVPFFSVENIVSGKANKFISIEDYREATRKNKPEKNDVLVTRIGNIGFSAVVDWGYEFSIYATLATIKQDKRFISGYLHGYMQSERYQREIQSKSLLNAVPCINMDELRKTEMLLPCRKEQQKIADCLSSLDELITAHTQKHEAFKSYKKGLMQQLFPAKGETVPKLRFPEFQNAGEWSIKSTRQLFKVGNGKDHKHLADGDIPVYGSGGYMRSANEYLYDGESACIGRKGTIDKPIFLSGKFWTVDTLFYTHSFKECLPKFIYLIFQKINWRSHNEAGGVPSLSKKNIEKIEVAVPKLCEQNKISDCLSSVDELITEQAQKIAELKAHKKGLMQQLFPAIDEVGA